MSPKAAKNPSGTARRARGEGSITKRADGTYQGSVALPIDADGKRRRKYLYAANKADLVRKMDDFKSELRKRGDMLTSSPTLEEWTAYWLKNVFRGRPTTAISYGSSIRNHILPTLGSTKLDKLSVEQVQLWLTRLQAPKPVGRGLSSTSARLAYGILRKIMNDAVKAEKVYRNVVSLAEAPAARTGMFKTLTKDEAITVIKHTLDDRNGSRIAMALLTGARQGECLGLRWEDIDFTQNTVTIRKQLVHLVQYHGCRKDEQGEPTCGRLRGKECTKPIINASDAWRSQIVELYPGRYLAPLKSKAGHRKFPLVEPLRSMLLAHKQRTRNEPNPHGLVWTTGPKQHFNGVARSVDAPTGEPLDAKMDNTAWNNTLVSAGVKRVRLHDARHTTVTLLVTLGIDPMTIQQIVGHSSVAQTIAYNEYTYEQAVPAMQALSDAFGLEDWQTLMPGDTIVIHPRELESA